MHICSSSEYSFESRIPIINNPDEKTIYLVPASYQPSNNMFTEWVYVNNTWEIFGSVAIDLSNYLTDVQINGTSIVTNGVAKVPIATGDKLGLVGGNFSSGVYVGSGGKLSTWSAPSTTIKAGTHSAQPIVPVRQHESVFYGLAKAAGHDEKNSTLAVGTYTDEAKTAIQEMLDVPSTNDVQSLQTAVQSKADAQAVTTLSGTVTGLQTSKADKSYVDTQLAGKASTQTVSDLSDDVSDLQTGLAGKVGDVQIDGTSIVTDGIAEVPIANISRAGVVKVNSDRGISMVWGTTLQIVSASSSLIKNGTSIFTPVSPNRQHESAFYGLAKAAGHDEKNSTLPVGTYTDEAKAAIQTMLDVPSTGAVTDLQTGKADKSYVDTQLDTKASTATATTSANGLMSATDKGRLDALYDDYSSALTALGVIE